jgi:hypothetical protein
VRIGNLLFFAPGVRFDEVDLSGATLPRQLQKRLNGYYIEPAGECCRNGHAFAAGALLVSCIDAIGRLKYGGGVGVGDRFRRAAGELSSFAAPDLAARFYDEFRNGLVHEARLKRGGQFSLERDRTVEVLGGVLLVNPRRLVDEVRDSLTQWVTELCTDDTKRAKLATLLRRDFADDFRIAKK